MKLFGRCLKTAKFVFSKTLCKSEKLQRFQISSERTSISGKKSSAGFSRVHSTCPEKTFSQFRVSKNLLCFRLLDHERYLSAREGKTFDRLGLWKLQSKSPHKSFRWITFPDEKELESYPSRIGEKEFRVLKKFIAVLMSKVKSMAQGKVSIIRNFQKLQFFHCQTRNRKKIGLLAQFLGSVVQTVFYLSRRAFSGNRSILKQSLKNPISIQKQNKKVRPFVEFF